MKFYITDSVDLPWIESPFPGISEKFLKIQEGASGVVDLTRIQEGASLPPHRHLVRQRSFFLEGLGEALDGTRMRAGTYAEVAPGIRHGTKSIEGQVVILNFFDGPVTWVLDNGDVFALVSEGKNEGTITSLGKIAAPETRNLLETQT